MKPRWECFVRAEIEGEEPMEIVLTRRRFHRMARWDRSLAAPNLAAIAYFNTLNPDRRILSVVYDVRSCEITRST